MKLLLTAFVILIVAPSNVSADSEMAPHPYVVASFGGRFYFKMVTDTDDLWDKTKCRGILFRVTNNSRDEVAWETKGWYSHQVFISSDGVYLVRIGDWPRGHEPSDKDLAIAFYKRGKEIRRYSTKDLIRDVTQVRGSVSHYVFQREIPGFKNSYDDQFSLVTIDNIEYIFDIKTGKILKEIDGDTQ